MIKNLSIQSKLIWIAIFTTGCALLLANIGNYRHTSMQTLQSKEQNLTILSQIIANRSKAALAFSDETVASKNLASLYLDKTIQRACLYKRNGKLFSSYVRSDNKDGCNKTETSLSKGDGVQISYYENADGDKKVASKTAIELNDDIIGYLTIHSNQNEIESINLSIIRNAIVFSLFAFILAIFLVLFLKSTVTKPIHELTITAKQVSASGDFSNRAKKISNDETGYLTDQFNNMLETIEVQEENLQTQKQELESLVQQLEYQATHDGLTDLYNRAAFESIVVNEIDKMNPDQSSLLCYIDLDQFKILNDTCGHFVGDELLRRIAKIMNNVFHTRGVVCRMGGDEFVVLLKNCNPKKGKAILKQFLDEINRLDYTWSGRHFPISASAGIATINHESNFKELLMEADSACYNAKRSGSSHIHMYTESDTDFDQRHSDIVMVNHLIRSLKEDRFQLYTQPIFNNQSKNSVYSHEVLLRLTDKDEKLLPAYQFLSVAENNNLMPEIDRWVIKTLFKHIHQHGNGIKYFINLSGDTLSDKCISDEIKSYAKNLDIDPKSICFEITETSNIHDMENGIELIDNLRSCGFEFALDDFGTGYSTMDYLRSLDVEYIKLDGSLIQNIHNDTISMAFADAVNKISHLANKQTIAEHISSQQIYETAKMLGVDYFQGFWLQKPARLIDKKHYDYCE